MVRHLLCLPNPIIRLCVLGALVHCVAAAAAGGGAHSVFLEELTSFELRAAVESGSTTVLVPIGGTEQNGPHMALGKHNVRVKALAGQIAQRLGKAVVRSSIPPGDWSVSRKLCTSPRAISSSCA